MMNSYFKMRINQTQGVLLSFLSCEYDYLSVRRFHIGREGMALISIGPSVSRMFEINIEIVYYGLLKNLNMYYFSVTRDWVDTSLIPEINFIKLIKYIKNLENENQNRYTI